MTKKNKDLKVFLATDSWNEQTNGVSTTLRYVSANAKHLDINDVVISPSWFMNLSCPGYPDVKLSYVSYRDFENISKMIWKPDVVHAATEGPIGLAARKFAIRNKIPLVTSAHTDFAEYMKTLYHVPRFLSWKYLQWFHGPAIRTLAPSNYFVKKLKQNGVNPRRLRKWGRGVNTMLFSPLNEHRRYRYLTVGYVGRVSKEKNIEGFLNEPLGPNVTKVVVGDGPYLETLREKYRYCAFHGRKGQIELPSFYQTWDAMVFPSHTDTFGIVMLEAMASGCPVIAPQVPPQTELIFEGINGYFYGDGRRTMRDAALLASCLDRKIVANSVAHCGWEQVAEKWRDVLKEAIFEFHS